MSDPINKAVSLTVDSHPRLSEFKRLVYPVVSRRAGGISLGINLNPGKSCSYNCVYCQVDRTIKIKGLKVDLNQIADELDYWIRLINEQEGDFFDQELKDISIAGDGEPTLCKLLPELLIRLTEFKAQHHLDDCKLVLFSNGSNINRPELLKVLPQFYQYGGQIWYKLDFWDEASYQRINRGKVAYSKIIENLVKVGSKFPVVLQSCFFSWQDQPFSVSIYRDYIKLVNSLLQSGVKIKLIQVYTLARKPAESDAKAWSDRDMKILYKYLTENLDLNFSLIFSNPVISE